MNTTAANLTPLSDAQPCGPSLEYDTDFAVLQSKLSPRAQVQYGDFVQEQAGPDWGEIERDARRLLQRSRDIQVLVWFTRARTQCAGAAGLHEGLGWLLGLLQAWSEQLHPQLVIDGQPDPAVRANALAALVDPEGLLGDIRQIVVVSGSSTRLSMRDVERAFARVRQPDALNPQAVREQLRALHARHDPTLARLTECADLARALARAAEAPLGEHAPDFAPLLGLLGLLDTGPLPEPAPTTPSAAAPAAVTADEAVITEPVPPTALVTVQPTSPTPPLPVAPTHAEQREAIRLSLHHARLWIEHNEPSSPVSILLKHAERLWGRRFADLAQAIPPELVQAWDQE